MEFEKKVKDGENVIEVPDDDDESGLGGSSISIRIKQRRAAADAKKAGVGNSEDTAAVPQPARNVPQSGSTSGGKPGQKKGDYNYGGGGFYDEEEEGGGAAQAGGDNPYDSSRDFTNNDSFGSNAFNNMGGGADTDKDKGGGGGPAGNSGVVGNNSVVGNNEVGPNGATLGQSADETASGQKDQPKGNESPKNNEYRPLASGYEGFYEGDDYSTNEAETFGDDGAASGSEAFTKYRGGNDFSMTGNEDEEEDDDSDDEDEDNEDEDSGDSESENDDDDEDGDKEKDGEDDEDEDEDDENDEDEDGEHKEGEGDKAEGGGGGKGNSDSGAPVLFKDLKYMWDIAVVHALTKALCDKLNVYVRGLLDGASAFFAELITLVKLRYFKDPVGGLLELVENPLLQVLNAEGLINSLLKLAPVQMMLKQIRKTLMPVLKKA